MVVTRRTRCAVPFVPVIKGQQDAAEVARQLSQLIESREASGWRFCQLESVRTVRKNGCLAALAGNPTSDVFLQVAVFERDDPPEPDPRQVFGPTS